MSEFVEGWRAPRVLRALWTVVAWTPGPWVRAGVSVGVALGVVLLLAAHWPERQLVVAGVLAGVLARPSWERLFWRVVGWTARGRCECCGGTERQVGKLRTSWETCDTCCADCAGFGPGWTVRT